MTEQSGKALSLHELPDLRRKTDSVAALLKAQLIAHLETLRPLFAPERTFGKLAGGRTEVTGAERAFAELQQKYKPYAGRPYDLPAEFDQNWLTLAGNALDVQPWEYSISVQGRPITMSSPVKWVLTYRSSLTIAQTRSLLAAKEIARRDELRQTAVNALVLQLVLGRHPGIVQLFRDLRFEIATEAVADLPGYPVTTITSCLTSFRPADDLVSAATAFSGVPSFIELIDLEAVRQPRDLLQEKLREILG